MSVLVDTGVLYADHDRDATRHEAAVRALEAVYDGRLGRPYISDYVFDEAVTLTRSRASSVGPALRLSERLRGDGSYPALYELLWVSQGVLDEALAVFERYGDYSLSFTDATTITLVDRHDIDGVLTFDTDFDGLVQRYDPELVDYWD